MLLFVRVLMLVACGPLLVPAGLCVCHADEPHHTDAPAHDDHKSDCPASVRVDASQPTTAVLILDAGPTPEPLAFSFPHSSPTPPSRSASPETPSRPLYVSHCALVL